MAPEPREERFNLRLTAGELAMLNELAEAMGVSASDVVRLLVRKAHEERFGVTKKPKPKK